MNALLDALTVFQRVSSRDSKQLWLRLWTLLLLLPTTGSAKDITTLTLYTYHDKPPYFYAENLDANGQKGNSGQGLYEIFAAQLNQQLLGSELQVKYLPRRRIDRLLSAQSLDGGIIGINPKWFRDPEQTKYLWSQPFMDDKDVFVVHVDSDITARQPNDFVGKTMALTSGFYFVGITELVRNGQIRSINTPSESHNLNLLLKGRADATIMSILTLNQLVKATQGVTEIRALSVPHDQFQRHIMFPRQLESEVVHRALRTIPGITASEQWKRLLESYH